MMATSTGYETQKLSALILIADGSEEIEFVTPYEYVTPNSIIPCNEVATADWM